MNFTGYPAGPRQQVKANGQTKVSKAYKKSRMENLRGSGKSKAIPQASQEESTQLLSPFRSSAVVHNAQITHSHHKMSREVFEGEVEVEEDESQDELDSMDVVLPSVASANVPVSPQCVGPPFELNSLPGPVADPAPDPVPALAVGLSAQTLPVAAAAVPSRQKPFSASGKASQRSTISSVWGSIKDFTINLLKQKGRTAENDEDIGHILQHAGGRVLNESTNSRGNIEALEMLNIFQGKPADDSNVRDPPDQVPMDKKARKWERYTLAKSQVVQNLVKTYTQAADGVAGKDTRARVLSALAESFSLRELNAWVFGLFGQSNVSISKHTFKTARLNALACGAGNVPAAAKTVRRSIDMDMLRVPDGGNEYHSAYTFCTEFIQTFLTPLAFGTRQTTLSTGEVLELNKIERTRSKEEIKKLYFEACDHGFDTGVHGEHIAIPRVPSKHLDIIIDTLSGGAENASLAALDSVYCKFGLQNFELFRRFIQIICKARPDVEAELMEKCSKVETFLRKEYTDHIFESSLCDSHSKKHAFSDGPRMTAFRGEFVTEFYDVLSDDATEDGWAVGRALVPVLKQYRTTNQQITEAILLTDGAGNFSGTEFWVFLSLVHLLAGMRILMHIVKEAGCGKSFLDTHFAFCMHIIALLVAEGRGTMDVTCAADVVRNLTTNAGIANSTAVLLHYSNRPISTGKKSANNEVESSVTEIGDVEDGAVDESADAVSDGYKTYKGLGKFAQREYNYDQNGHFVSCSLSKVALYADVPDLIVPEATMRSCCPNNAFPTAADIDSSISATFHNSSARNSIATVDAAESTPSTLTGPQLVLSEQDRQTREAYRQRQLSAKAVRQDAKAHEKEVILDAARAQSKLHYCPQPNCNFYSSTASGLQRHLSNSSPDAHQVTTARMSLNFTSTLGPHSDNDALKVFCHTRTALVKQSASKNSHLSPSRQEHLVPYEIYEQQYPQYARDAHHSASIRQLFHAGFGHQKQGKTVYNTSKTLDFIVFLTGRGDPAADNGNKTLPAQAEKAMLLLGTHEGANVLSETPHDRERMRANPANNRTFRLSELLSQDQLKAQMSRPLGQLKKSAERARAIEREAALCLADPLRGVINKASKSTLQCRWRQLLRRHQDTHLLPFEAAVLLVMSIENMTLAELRVHTMQFMNLSERQAADMHFFGL